MAWLSVIAARPRAQRTLDYSLQPENLQSGWFLQDFDFVARAALTLNQLERLSPHIELIRQGAERLVAVAPRLGPPTVARLVAASLTLELLTGEENGYLEAIQQADASEEVVRIQQTLAARPIGSDPNGPKPKAFSRTRAAFLRHIESCSAEVALELAHCPGYSLYGSCGVPFVLLLARLRRSKLATVDGEVKLDEIVRWGTNWHARGSVLGWQVLNPGAESSPARVYVAGKGRNTVYHWCGFECVPEEALRLAREASEFASSPHLRDLEENPEVKAELVEAIRGQLNADELDHVLVVDKSTKGSGWAQISRGLPPNLTMLDVLEA